MTKQYSSEYLDVIRGATRTVVFRVRGKDCTETSLAADQEYACSHLINDASPLPRHMPYIFDLFRCRHVPRQW